MTDGRKLDGKSIKDFLLKNNVYILCIALLLIPGFFSKTYLSNDSLTLC